MIIQTGNRTDIPAFYSEWFANRLREGFVLVRNPFQPQSITRYELNPEVVDLIVFCTKNPAPLFRYMDLLNPYRQYWFVTITPYGTDIEPNVPPKGQIMDSFIRLSRIVGADAAVWRYDPIIVDKSWTVERHLNAFRKMCAILEGYTRTCVISFIDLYEKVKRNYPDARSVSFDDQVFLTREFVAAAAKHQMKIKLCAEDPALGKTGADISGCMTIKTFEEAVKSPLIVPANPKNRRECACYLTGDIGQYDTCAHLCRYCYANTRAEVVRENRKHHDPASPLLIGHVHREDVIHKAKQSSWIDPQMRFDFI